MSLYQLPKGVVSRMISFENPTGQKGQGGLTNRGAKGSAFTSVETGQTIVLANIKGSGRICRIWATLSQRDTEMLQNLIIRCYWDESDIPAVEIPICEFFGTGQEMKPFQNALFSSPEGRSFNCFIPMPFAKAAKITLTNQGSVSLGQLYYDLDYVLLDKTEENAGYFHAITTHSPNNPLGQDVDILPHQKGRGRYLGTLISTRTKKEYGTTWFGEGEVKVYLDGDKDYPTLCGTGTEDYIGTGYGQGVYAHESQGCFVASTEEGHFCFYRYHVKDPIYFDKDIRVTIQAMGGANGGHLKNILSEGAKIIPVTIHYTSGLQCIYGENVEDWPDDSWVNFYRSDDYTCTAYFYLDRP